MYDGTKVRILSIGFQMTIQSILGRSGSLHLRFHYCCTQYGSTTAVRSLYLHYRFRRLRTWQTGNMKGSRTCNRSSRRVYAGEKWHETPATNTQISFCANATRGDTKSKTSRRRGERRAALCAGMCLHWDRWHLLLSPKQRIMFKFKMYVCVSVSTVEVWCVSVSTVEVWLEFECKC